MKKLIDESKETFTDEEDEEIFRLALKYNPPLEIPDSLEKQILESYRRFMEIKGNDK